MSLTELPSPPPPPSIPLAVDPQNLLQSSLLVVFETFPHWKEDYKKEKEVIVLEECCNGITNKLVKCTNKIRKVSLLIRTYGKGSEEIIDRENEISISIRLSSLGLCPPIHSTFKNGFVYGFTEGTPLTLSMMREEKISKLIAKTLSNWHKVPITFGGQGGGGEKSIFHSLRKLIIILDEKNIKAPFPISDIDLIERMFFENNYGKRAFCHNDLLSGNLILSPEEDFVSLIDFEYGGENFVEFDIANHFCEWCGFDFDPSLFPSQGEREIFLCEYLQEKPSESFKRGISFMVLCSHLYWGIWALIQNSNSDIDFDYLTYSKKRISLFLEEKGDLLLE